MNNNKERIDAIVNTHYEKWIENASSFIKTEDVYDVINTVVMSLYDRDYDIKESEIDRYINGAAKIAYWSKTSPYNRELDNHIITEDIQENTLVSKPDFVFFDERNTTISDAERAHSLIEYINEISELSWWEKQCFLRKVLEDKTFKVMSEELGCSISQLYYSYKKVKTYLKNKIQYYD